MSLASARVWKAALLGLVTTTVIPGGVAFSQAPTGAIVQVPSFTVIDLTSKGFYAAYAISGGQVVGFSFASGLRHAMLWKDTAESAVDLHPGSGFANDANGSQAMGISGGQQVGWAHTATVTLPAHALLWHGTAESVVDLHPSGFDESWAYGTSGGQQVGAGRGPATGGKIHALLWRGSADSVVDLHPSGFAESWAFAADGGQQVGYRSSQVPDSTGEFTHAVLWAGSAASMVDLNPSGFTYSEAHGVSGGQQVGLGYGPATRPPGLPGDYIHALLWQGSAADVVDLHPKGFEISEALGTNGEAQVGWGQWPATGESHALLWRGSAVSVVDLHAFLPSGFDGSEARGIDSTGNIVGIAWIWRPNGMGLDKDERPFLWVPAKKPGPH